MLKKAITLNLGLVLMGSAVFAQDLNDAKKAIDAEQYQKATSMLKNLVKTQASKGENYFNLGLVYLKTGYPDSARAVFNNGIAADAKNALNYVGLGEADLLDNNAVSAKTNFDKALSISKDYKTYLYVGKAYLAQDKPSDQISKPDFAAALENVKLADEKDTKDKDAEVFLALGDVYALQKMNSDALTPYFTAGNINPTLYRSKVQIGKMYKEARAFNESETELKGVIEADANYGPAYRELAELYMQWANTDPKSFDAKAALALTNYKKYLDLTDKSFDSQLRYAQFLFYAHDFKTLEQVTAELAKGNSNNPKYLVIRRMLGYSAYENGKYPEALNYMNEFFAQVKDQSRVRGADYLYLGKSQLKLGQDSVALGNLIKAAEMDSTETDALAELATTLYKAKKYTQAATAFRKALQVNPKSKSAVTQQFYLGNSNYFAYALADRDKKNPDKKMLVEADSAFSYVNINAPEFPLAYIYRARVASFLDDKTNPKGLSVPFLEKFIELVTVKKPELAANHKNQLVEAYDNLGGFYAATDKAKAIDYLKKSIALNPEGDFAPAKLKELIGGGVAPKPKAPLKKK